MNEHDNYRTLFIEFAKPDEDFGTENDTVIYTQIGDFTPKSFNYRTMKWNLQTGHMTPISYRQLPIWMSSYEEARHLQRVFNEVFKPWQGNKELGDTVTVITRFNNKKLSNEEFATYIDKIMQTLHGELNKYKVRFELMHKLKQDIPFKDYAGMVYLLKITNIYGTRYKIGLTTDAARRINELTSEYNGTVEIVDLKKTNEMKWDEALLQMLCSSHKSKDRLNGKYKEDEEYNSELYYYDNHVKTIWDAYWAHK